MTYVIINLAIVAVIWVGARQVDAGILTQGKVIALVNYMSQILVELIKMANLIILISKAAACMNRVDGVFAITSSVKEPAGAAAAGKAGMPGLSGDLEEARTGRGRENGAAAPAVEFRDVEAAYACSGNPALSGISFQAKRGETIGIIGGTGSGKTTLVNLIPRFYDAAKGQVLVNGRDVREYSLEELRGLMGVVPQRAVLFKGSLRENMKWGRQDASDEEIWEALGTAQARDFVEDKKQGLDLSIEQEGRNLSGGQRQRLTIARALTGSPRILILDDSCSALDFQTDARLRANIAAMRGVTTVIVSQRASSIRNADVIYVMEDGKVVGQGKHAELYGACPLYKEICDSQSKVQEGESGNE